MSRNVDVQWCCVALSSQARVSETPNLWETTMILSMSADQRVVYMLAHFVRAISHHHATIRVRSSVGCVVSVAPTTLGMVG